MKKANFIVVFWLILSMISFIVFVFSFSSLWNDIAFWIIPSKDPYMSKAGILRDLIKEIPMLILSIIVFYFGLKQGLQNYHNS